ncbi:MAG: hypothetical protein U0998_00685 [Moraxellaceae bacterium]|nr:hypothetical protein [Moraxellaceae bacterium]MDZ4385717.1 hypothetical protein [Moraxellaceae bacterium]
MFTQIVKRATFTSLLVGTLLTLVHQWDAIVGQAVMSWWSCAANFVIPFCVSLQAGLSARRI